MSCVMGNAPPDGALAEATSARTAAARTTSTRGEPARNAPTASADGLAPNLDARQPDAPREGHERRSRTCLSRRRRTDERVGEARPGDRRRLVLGVPLDAD